MLSCIVFEKMEHLSRLSRWHTEKYILAAARSNLQLKQIPSTFHLEKTQRDQISARFVISERRDLRETEKKQENRQTGWDLSNNGDRVFLEKTESGKIKGMWTVNKTRLGVKLWTKNHLGAGRSNRTLLLRTKSYPLFVITFEVLTRWSAKK